LIQITWPGSYLDGKTADKQAVTIHLHNDGLKIAKHDGEVLWWPYRDIRQVQGFYENEPVRLERGENLPGALIIADPEFLASLREFAPDSARRFHNPAFRSIRVKLTIMATIAVVALGVFLYRWGIPLMAAAITPLVPIEWEKGLGQSALNVLAPEETQCKDSELNQTIEQIVSRLTAQQPKSYPFRVFVIDSPIFNAVALPGGSIVVFRGLLKKTQSPEELTGVIAHEMQHIVRRHVTKRIIEDSSTGILITIVSGDVSGAMMYGVKIANDLALLSYSRQDEEEADAEGMKMILFAGLDPAGMISFFETSRGESKLPIWFQYLSTHPDVRERIARLRAVVAEWENRGPPRAALTGNTIWNKIRDRCNTVNLPGKPVK